MENSSVESLITNGKKVSFEHYHITVYAHIRIYSILCFLLGSSAVPLAAKGFAGQLGAGLDVGYSATFKRANESPDTLDGLAVGMHVTYGITSRFGLAFEGHFDWHPDYIMQSLGETVDENGEIVVDFIDSATVRHCYLTSVASSIVYAIDVMRAVPYLSLGLVGTRSDQEINSFHLWEYDLGVRISFGFTYALFEHLLLGAVLHSDTYLLAESPYNTRVAILARVAFVFDVNSKILSGEK